MPQHGVVRKKPWALAASDDATATFRTESDDATRESYPFEFTLDARFALEGRSLLVRYEVTNKGKDVMYFSIGSHPAFSLPFAGGYIENYYLHFSEPEDLFRPEFKGKWCTYDPRVPGAGATFLNRVDGDPRTRVRPAAPP